MTSYFSPSYKATIGCDYVVKTLAFDHLATPDVHLAIWDTAGQERYASLSTAFFRGADAVIFFYDSSDRKTLDALERWWAVFRDKCPVREGTERDFPIIVVGNKSDLAGTDKVEEADVQVLWDRLVPPPVRPPPGPLEGLPEESDYPSSSATTSTPRARTHSIKVSPASPPLPHHNHNHLFQAAPSSYQTPSSSFSSALHSALSEQPPIGPPPLPSSSSGHMMLPPTSLGGYHIPPAVSTSSIYSFKTAKSHQTTVAFPSGSSPSTSDWDAASTLTADREHRRNRSTSSKLSFSSAVSGQSETGSTATVRPPRRSLLSKTPSTQRNDSPLSGASTPTLTPPRTASPSPAAPSRSDHPPPHPSSTGALIPPTDEEPSQPTHTDPPEPPQGPVFFPFCSAKTGEGVSDVFEFVARSVSERREWEERRRDAFGWEADDGVDLAQTGDGKGRLARWCAC